MPELALDDVDRDALAGELNGVSVPELMRREPTAHAGFGRELAELAADGGRGPSAAASRSVDHAEQWSDRQPNPVFQPRAQVLEPEVVHAGVATLVILAVANQQRPAALVDVSFGQCQRV